MWELLAGNRTAILTQHAREGRSGVCVPLALIFLSKIVNLTVLLHEEFEIPTLRRKFLHKI